MEESITLEINAYDNEVSIMYKWAVSFETPIKYLVVEETSQEKSLDVAYRSLFFEVQDHLNLSLMDIYNYLNTFRDRILDLDLEQDLPYIYYYIHSQGEPTPEDPEDLVDEIVKYFTAMKVTQSVSDYPSWVPSYENWLRNYNQEYEKTLEIYNFITDIQKTLNEYNPLPASHFKLERVLLESSLPGMTPEDGIEVFDHMKLSFSLPYAQYNGALINDRLQRYFKIYVRHEQVSSKIYDLIIPNLKKASRPMTLYATLWAGVGEVWNPIADNYSQVTYHLDTNKLQINIPIVVSNSRQLVLGDLKKSLGGELLPGKEVRLSGYFFLYNIELVEVSFLDLLLNEDLFSSYLFISEVKTPVSQKKRLRFRFKSLLSSKEESESSFEESAKIPSSITFSLYQMYMGTEETHNGHKYRAGTPYLRVNILEGRNSEEVEHFITIFSRLMSFYKEHNQVIINHYKNYFPDENYQPEKAKSQPSTPQVSEPSTPSTPTGLEGKEEEEETKELEESEESEEPEEPEETTPLEKGKARAKAEAVLGKLQARARDLFSSNYGRTCQGTERQMRQPTILSEEEARDYKNKERQVLKFPYRGGYLLIGCPQEDYPFPGLQVNTHENKDKFPYIPCCFKKDQTKVMSVRVAKPRTKVQGSETTKSGLSVSYIIRSDKPLDPDRFGYSPKSVADILEKYREPNENLKITRYGVSSSPSSLIHCLFVALQDDRYLKLNPGNKIVFVDAFRKELSSSIKISLLKQELYDYNEEEIGKQLTDKGTFFDARLFYRALEEIFNVNIFVFTHIPAQGTHISSGNIEILEIPRSKFFHIRQTRLDRMSVIVYKNMGTSKNPLTHPQYELLVDMNLTTKATTKVFREDMTKLLYQVLHSVSPLYSWKFNEENLEGKPLSPEDQLEGSLNSLNIINYRQIIGLPLSSQLLDEYGKLRGYNYLLNNGLKMTVIVPPSQPENVPLGSIESLPYEEAIKVFNQGPSRIVKEEGRLTGLWFPVYQDPHGIYVQVNKIPVPDSLENIPEGPPNPLVGFRGVNMINRLTKLRRIINFLLQIILWAFLLVRQENKDISVNEFAERYFIEDENVISDSLVLYDFSGLQRELPKVTNINDLLTYLKENVRGLIEEDRIYLYSSKLIDGVVYFLNQFVKNTKVSEIPLPTHLNNYYMTEEDFQYQENVLFFINETDFQAWMETLEFNERNIIRFTLSPNYKTEINPYIYKTPEGQIYLIQNVLEGNLKRALNVAQSWKTEKVNPGYTSPLLSGSPYYRVYGISNANSLFLIEDSPEDQAYDLLTYEEGNYAALLPMGAET